MDCTSKSYRYLALLHSSNNRLSWAMMLWRPQLLPKHCCHRQFQVIVAQHFSLWRERNKKRGKASVAVLRLEENLQPSEFSNTYQEFMRFNSPFARSLLILISFLFAGHQISQWQKNAQSARKRWNNPISQNLNGKKKEMMLQELVGLVVKEKH